MTLSDAIILSVVEGITEFLPISSTGHMTLVSHLLSIPQTVANTSFEIFIQLGAIAAIVLFTLPTLTKTRENKLLIASAVAFIPTGIGGFILYPIIKNYLLGNTAITSAALVVGGLFLIFFEKSKLKKNETYAIPSIKQAFLIGLVQMFSFVPGVSRAAATIIGGMATGLSRESATQFSFILAIPTMLAASIYDLVKSREEILQSSSLQLFVIGFIIAFVVAYLTVWWFSGYIKKHTFVGFGVYRIIIGVAFLFLIGI